MSKALNILITRPTADARPVADLLRQKGHTAIIEPVMEIKYSDDAKELEDALSNNPDCLLITSANGIRAFSNLSNRRDFAVYAVGDISADEAKKIGFEEVYSASGDVGALAKLVTENCDRNKRFLHVVGSSQAGDLKGQLEEEGYAVDMAVIYLAEAVTSLSPQAKAGFLNCEIDAVLFYSPRTAEIFLELVKEGRVDYLLKSSRAICLSKAVADVIKQGEWLDVLVADEPNQDSLLSLIEEI